MAAVIVHYHLSEGGVARVIEESSRVLSLSGTPHLILTGSAPTVGGLPFQVIDGLDYQTTTDGPDARELLRRMRDAVSSMHGPGPHVWHFHNHALGMNVRMAEIVAMMAREGERLVLQLHDVAEDGRPENYARLTGSDTPYPHAPQIRYAFLNSRDRENFIAAGLPEKRSMLLPNPIRIPDSSPTPAQSPARVLYAVRGIRRKNLGEVLLLAALSPPGTRYATTLAPARKRWLPVFEVWQAFAMSSGLPVDLAVVGRLATESGDSSFEAWQSQATHFLTTSVAEGFGLGFLEPLALGKPVFGRDLPAITRDQLAQGVKSDRLYTRLLIPAAWIDLERLYRHLTHALRRQIHAYGLDLTTSHVQKAWDAIRFGRHLDFGNLPEDLQLHVLRHLSENRDRNEILVEIAGERFHAVDWLEETLGKRTPSVRPDQLDHYSPAAHLSRLNALYHELLGTAPQPPDFLSMDRVLGTYLRPEHFHFLLS